MATSSKRIAQFSSAWLVGALLLLTGCVNTVSKLPGSDAAAKAADSTPPNIVFILADDLGIGDTGVYGSRVIKTPNIDALAYSGVRFTQGYVSHPVCSPSRAGLLTGRYQQRHGWEFNPAGRDVDSGMAVGETTFADALNQLGYATGMIGKWHLGYKGAHHPNQRGFDEYFGVLAGGSIFIDHEVTGVETVGARLPRTRSASNAVFRNSARVEVTDYLTDVFTAEAVDFVDRHAGEPFLLYLSHTTPHTPLQATAEYLDRYRHIEDPGTRVYAAMVSSLDDSVGRIVAKLKEKGVYDNTLIVLLSDNGCAGYINGACSNAPFAGFKRYHQEGGIRVPFIMNWPAGLPSGILFDKPVISLDLFATFTAAAGQPQPTEDSVNLLPYLRGETATLPHDFLYWRAGPTRAIRDARWKLIEYKRVNLTRDALGNDGRLAPPPGGWPNNAPEGHVTLLYDLANDESESNNLASSRPDIVTRLKARHDHWSQELKQVPILPAIRSTLADMHGETVQLIF